jgi:alcohol dehydrogenase class IV
MFSPLKMAGIPMRFEFATAGRVVFGAGTLKEAATAAHGLGQRALLVVGKSTERASGLIDALTNRGIQVTGFHISGEPTVELVLSGVQAARQNRCDLVIGMGGGSVLDAGKAIAALMTNPGDALDYLEVVGKGQPLLNLPAPYIAIPTTAGTGSEATRNAVLAVPEKRVKVSLRSASMLPRLAIVDPELTYSLSPEATAATGLDALTQLIEPFLSNAANPLTDALCREGIRRAARSLRRACQQGDDVQAREDMSLASLFGGMALANAKLGAVHGFAGPLGGMFPAPHGAICARLLPLVLDANLTAMQKHAPLSTSRFDEVAQLLTGGVSAQAKEGVLWLKELAETLKIPPLAAYGIQKSDFPEIVAQAKKASSMKGNPIELSDGELMGILEQAV